jgi:hypothetical protein
MSARASAARPESGFAAALLEGISAISEQQMPTGEVGSYGPGADGRLAYRRSLGASIAVHEALACFDPSSAWEETCSVRGLLPAAAMRRLCLGAARVRHRIRAFLAWQEPADHLWREGGKHGGTPADPALSAAAALALMDDPARAPGRWWLYARALDRFRGADGLYLTEGGGAGPLANAPVAELLALAGEDMDALAASLLQEVDAAAGRSAAIPLDLACAAARCWARAHLPGRCRLAAALAPGLLERLRSAGAGGETVPAAPAAHGSDTARILLALLDLGSTSPELEPAARRMLGSLPLMTGWADDHAAVGGVRCPSLTWALVLAAAARSQALAAEVSPCTALAS